MPTHWFVSKATQRRVKEAQARSLERKRQQDSSRGANYTKVVIGLVAVAVSAGLYLGVRVATNNSVTKTYVLTPNFRVHKAQNGAPVFAAARDRYGPLYFRDRVPIRATFGESVTYRVRLATSNPLDSNLAFTARLELPGTNARFDRGRLEANYTLTWRSQ